MAYQRDFAVQLRIYEPLAAHPEYEDFPVSDNRDIVEGLIAQDADERLISLPPNPVADSYRATPIFLPAELSGDGIDRVCPAQDDIRSWHALEALTESTSKFELDIVAPKKARRSAHSRRVEWMQDEPDTRVFTRTATWDVPPIWWLAVSPQEDDEEIITVPKEAGDDSRDRGAEDYASGGGDTDAVGTDTAAEDAVAEDATQARFELATVRRRIRVPLFTASARVEWAYDVMKEKSRLTAIVESTENLVEWFKSFDLNSVVELDLGGLSDVIQVEEASSLVTDWIDSLDADDMESAIAAFREYSRLWETMVLFSRGS